MAERRMFAKTIIDSDAFLEMPVTSRLLYYDLAMRADDDGFNNSPKKLMKIIGATEDDLKILIARKFVIPFDNGVVVIKHWRIHNYIRKDTYKETQYKEEKELLEVDENNAYRLTDGLVLITDSTIRQRTVDETLTQDRLGKDRLGKDRLGEESLGKEKKENIVKDIVEYLNNKLGTKYRASSDKTKKHINARLNEGFTFEDFKAVIDKKSIEWSNDSKMACYLRPETLFGTKFESYLNQKVVVPKNRIEINQKQREGMVDVVDWNM